MTDDTQTLTFQGPARLAALHLIDNTCLSYLAHTNGSTIGGGPLSLTDWGTTLEVEVRRSWSWSKGEEVLLDIMRRFSETSWSLLDEKTQRVALTALLLSCGKTAEGLVAAR